MLVGSTFYMAGLKPAPGLTPGTLAVLVAGISKPCGECRRNYIDNLQVPVRIRGRASAR